MKIINAIYTNADQSSLKATLDDGTVWHIPQPCETWHNEHLREFLAGGGVIKPMPAPDPAVMVVDSDKGWAVGSIQMSILATPPGPHWRLADGSDCTGTAYATATGDNTLPDLRGAYLRMAGRNASHASWDGDVLGSFQADSTAMPNIPFHVIHAGDHKHHLNMTAVANPNDKIHYTDWTRVAAGFNAGESPGDSYGAYWNGSHDAPVQVEGDHSHNLDGGDAETRPKTYSVNYFIKVD